MAVVDIFFLIIIAFFIFKGLIMGFVREFMNLAALFGGIAAGILAQPYLNGFLSKVLNVQGTVTSVVPDVSDIGNTVRWVPILSFLIAFLVTYIVIKLVELLILKAVDKIHLNQLNRIMGVMYGALEAGITILFIVFVVNIQSYVDLSTLFDESIIAGYAKEFLLDLELQPYFDMIRIGEKGV